MAHEAQPNAPVEDLLSELNATLATEREALKRLDRAAVEACADRKLHLGELLRLRAHELGRGHGRALAELRRSLRLNQILLVHARDQVAGTLQLLRGEPPGHCSGTLPAQGLRLDFRG